MIDGVARPLVNGIEGPRECRGGRDVKFDGRGVTLEFVMERRDLGNGIIGAPGGCGLERSDVGGDGGVGVSETVDEADFVGGVAMVGEDAVVVGEFSETGD